eukprot:3407017-Pyramimonas_sp.AAC.1
MSSCFLGALRAAVRGAPGPRAPAVPRVATRHQQDSKSAKPATAGELLEMDCSARSHTDALDRDGCALSKGPIARLAGERPPAPRARARPATTATSCL